MKQIALATYKNAPNLIEEDRPLIAALRKLGIEAIPWDWEVTFKNSFDCIVFRSCWNSHLKSEEFNGWLRSLSRKCLNPVPVIQWNLDKVHLLDLQNKGVCIPQTLLLEPDTVKNRWQRIQNSNLQKVVIKPTISASAHATFHFSVNEQELGLKALTAVPDTCPLLLQEFIPEVLNNGEMSYVFFNNKFSHAVRKVPLAGDFRVQEEFGGSRQAILASNADIAQCQGILRAANADDWLYARVDVVRRQKKFILMEIEAIDPMLYFTQCPEALERFAKAIAERIN